MNKIEQLKQKISTLEKRLQRIGTIHNLFDTILLVVFRKATTTDKIEDEIQDLYRQIADEYVILNKQK